MVGCSIGLAHKRVPVVGVIMMPFMNQLVSRKQFFPLVKLMLGLILSIPPVREEAPSSTRRLRYP